MPNKYDVIVVGMGPSSIFCAYELIKLNKFKKETCRGKILPNWKNKKMYSL